ncbi:hypothetical protein M6B38_278580 [Iris pallida]|uniref:Uncharacterized protein n=1 Tax=Iris pallida TaxID=29817 RepID=A0AAX6I0W2_IRIPA|nr:hypothetical protein M6B38_278580 [Iris pallida]
MNRQRQLRMPIMGTGIGKQVPANASCEKGKSSELMNGHCGNQGVNENAKCERRGKW